MIVTGIGEILWDIYDDGRYLGGAIANCIHHVRQLGHEGILISRIGSDKNGFEILDILKHRGLDHRFIQIDPDTATGWVRVSLDKNGIPTFACNPDAAYDNLEWSDDWIKVLPPSDAVLFGTFAQRTVQSARATRKFLDSCGSSLKVFDVNIRSWNETTISNIRECLPLSDILKLNDVEYLKLCEIFPGLSEEPVRGLNELAGLGSLRLVCYTAGTKGCLLANGENTVYSPGIRVKAIDTTGAGDAFIAALTIKYLEGKSVKEIGEFATRVAATVVVKKGATPEYSESTLVDMDNVGFGYYIKDEWAHLIP